MSGANLLVLGGTQAAAPVVYIEDVFSTYLYTGTGATQTITNNIDLSTKGGLVWIKERTSVAGAAGHQLTDTARGYEYQLSSNSTAAQTNEFNRLTSFNTNGFTLGNSSYVNANTGSWVSWTFREQPKFFDIVTYTGNSSNRTISHNLGSVPGCMIIKSTSTTYNWRVYHRSLGNTKFLTLDTTAAEDTGATLWNNTTPTSTEFTVGTASSVNSSGETYVAYLFAHDAGGFGLTGSDNVITCGSYTGNGSTSGPTVTLGYEPQWLFIKRATGGTGNWVLIDSMRGLVNSTTATPSDAYLVPNTTAAEQTWGDFTGTSNAAIPLATGFQIVTSTATLNNNTDTYIYIAIRRGPMKTPTSGTSVFTPVAYTGNGTARTTVTDIVTDLSIIKRRNTAYNPSFEDRLRGANQVLESNTTAAEIATTQYILGFDVQNGVRIGTDVGVNESGSTFINWAFSRAPGFFDVVCYTGTGSNTTISHNLGVAPELIICKSRSSNPGANWVVWHQTLNSSTGYLYLNATLEASTFSGVWNGAPTSTYFTLGTNYQNNNSGTTFVAYLFASVSGVSKVGSYTGTGTTLQVNCGFTNGSRFVLIKRTDSTGDWYVWDSARGIVAGNDPYLLLNSSAAEVTNTDYVDTYSAGFELSSTAPAGLNANGGSYIFLAIA